MRPEILPQPFVILPSTFRTADTVYINRQILKTYAVKEQQCQRYDLRISRWLGRSEQLYAELVKFPQPSFLLVLITEARYIIVHLCRQRILVKSVLQKAARCRGRTLRTQSYAPAALIQKCIHLLFHHIGRISYAALEKLCVLKGRHTYLPIPKGCAYLGKIFLQKMPLIAL